MSRLTLHLLLLVCVAWMGFACGQSYAQRPSVRGSTRVSPFSPYYDLLRPQVGILPNYYQFVQPRQRLNQQLQMQQREMHRQAANLSTLSNQVENAEGWQGRLLMRPTGTHGHFLDLGHWYSGQGSGGSSARRR